jgi:succinate dehydrogenase/fumarate reductase flavoprotein subunit
MGLRFSSDSLPTDPVDPSAGSLAYSGSERTDSYRDMARPAPRGHSAHAPVGDMHGSGALLQKALLERTRRSGATQLLKADARQLVRGDDGVVQGVIAEVDGELKSFRATRGVIVATGGFAHNREMVALHAPLYLNCVPVDVGWNDGWGIRAGQAVGAGLKGMGGADVTWPLYPPLSRKQGILINAQGQRFVPEDAYFGRIGEAIVDEQQGVAYLLLDKAARGNTAPMFPDENAAEDKSIAEIEGILGIPEPALRQTLDLYNSYAAKGEDPLFHKAKDHLRPLVPPFTVVNASIGHTTMTFFTLGGLRTTAKSEVLDNEGHPIPHLYAAGRASAGIACPYYYTSGLSLGDGITFGRIAGRNAARQGRARRRL